MTYVLNQLDKGKCSLDPLKEDDESKRADMMIKNSFAIGVPEIITAAEFIKANEKVNTIFVSEIFNAKHGL